MVHLSLCQNYKQFRIVIYNSRGVLTVNCIDYDSRVINYDRSVLFKIDHTSSATFLFSTNCYARTRILEEKLLGKGQLKIKKFGQ